MKQEHTYNESPKAVGFFNSAFSKLTSLTATLYNILPSWNSSVSLEEKKPKEMVADPNLESSVLPEIQSNLLIEAIYNKKLDTALKYIKELDAKSIGIKDDLGNTALHAVLKTEPVNQPILRALLNKDDEFVKCAEVNQDKYLSLINEKDKLGKTALHFVVENNQLAELDVLLRKSKLNVNRKDDLGNTALHYACKKDKDAILKDKDAILKKLLFRSNGAVILDLTVENRNGKKAFDLMSDELKEIVIGMVDKKGNTPLHIAAMQDSNESKYKANYEALKQLGFNEKQLNNNNQTPEIIFAEKAGQEITEEMKASGITLQNQANIENLESKKTNKVLARILDKQVTDVSKVNWQEIAREAMNSKLKKDSQKNNNNSPAL